MPSYLCWTWRYSCSHSAVFTEQTFAGFSMCLCGCCVVAPMHCPIHPPSGAYLVWLAVCQWGVISDRHAVRKASADSETESEKKRGGSHRRHRRFDHLGVVYGFIVQKYIRTFCATYLALFVCSARRRTSRDLAASAIKRKVGIKDYSKLIGTRRHPDRFDSMIMVARSSFDYDLYEYSELTDSEFCSEPVCFIKERRIN